MIYFFLYTDDVLIDKWMSGKLVCVWRSASIAEASRRRYLSAQEQLRTAHHEVANLFFSQFEDSDETPSDTSEPGILKKIVFCFYFSILVTFVA